jgi:hypothetical protein
LNNDWFSVDREGLRKLVEGRGYASILFELYQNSRDEASSAVIISFGQTENGKYAVSVHDDNPEGFKDLAHAYTLFAESAKKGNPEQAGRFNLGEKLVLAMCSYASIQSTKGTVIFDDQGRRKNRGRLPKGTLFYGILRRCTAADCEDAIEKFKSVIPKPGVQLWLNSEIIQERAPEKTIKVVLPTEIAGDDGVLRRTKRATTVNVYRVRSNETPTLYELGIPVVEIDCQWHVSVEQKVPLNMQRDNVTPGYLRDVRVAVLNAMFEELAPEQASKAWVRDAVEDPDITPPAVHTFLDKAFGEKRVSFDPTDPEANMRAVAAGYVVVHGRNLSAEAWENVRRANAILPAGQVTPSPKPYSSDGKPLVLLPDDKLTDGMKLVRKYATMLARRLMGKYIAVQFTNDPKWFPLATYGPGGPLTFNIGRLGKKWFEEISTKTDDLLIHEFGHEYEGNHLSQNYHCALTRLGAKLVALALNEPDSFAPFRKIVEPIHG